MTRSLLLRRLRGIAGTMLTWSVGGALAGAVVAGGISLAVLVPHGVAGESGRLMLGLGVAGAIAGAVSGLGFALLLLASARRRPFGELRLSRMGGLGAVAGAGMGLLISRDPTFAAVCGAIGFGAAATSLHLARRAAGPALGAGEGARLLAAE